MRLRRLTTSGAALLLSLQITSFGTAAEEEENQGPPLLRSGMAELVIERHLVTAPYDLTPFGPLFPLQPIVARLGGELVVGPLQQMHSLTVDGSTALFGPGVATLAIGEEIHLLSQPPRAGMGGLHVPVDLLEKLYGDEQGYLFEWDENSSTFTVDRAEARQLAVRPEIVHSQDVSTVVLTFSEKPRYRIREAAGLVEVALTNDRLQPTEPTSPPGGSWVNELSVATGGVEIRHRSGAVMESYELESPYRLVFDFYKGTPAGTATAPTRSTPPPKTRDLPGIHTIVIDPGHGGESSGAISANGVEEKSITLPIAISLKRALEAAIPVRVILTRTEDRELELDDRSAIANQNKADLFISLHVNSAYGRSAHGAETFFLSLQASDEMAAEIAAVENEGANGASENPLNDLDLILWDLAQSHHLAESQRFARLVQEELDGALGLTDRGVKQAPFRVLRGAAMPAVLVELGFLSNPTEERKLEDPAYRSQLVDALVRATVRYRALNQGPTASGEPASR